MEKRAVRDTPWPTAPATSRKPGQAPHQRVWGRVANISVAKNILTISYIIVDAQRIILLL